MASNCEQLKALQARLQKLQSSDMTKFCESCSKELAARLITLAVKRTPVGKYEKITDKKGNVVYDPGKNGGTLRRGWIAKSQEEAAAGKGKPNHEQILEYAQGLSISKSGNTYTVEVINPVEYASYVEFGHRQTPGRFVPAIGRRLKDGWVNGKYMLTLSAQDLERVAPGVLEKKLEALLQEVFNGD